MNLYNNLFSWICKYYFRFYVSPPKLLTIFQYMVEIKHIMVAKCNLFFYYHDAKVISFYNFDNTKFCAQHEKTYVNSIYIIGIMIVR